jgi:hypothetical protein
LPCVGVGAGGGGAGWKKVLWGWEREVERRAPVELSVDKFESLFVLRKSGIARQNLWQWKL